MASIDTMCAMPATEEVVDYIPTKGVPMNPPADVRADSGAERVVDLPGLKWRPSTTDEMPASDARMPAAVSSAFRRATKRVKAEREFSAASDVAVPDFAHTLSAISDAVRQALARGRCGPVSSGPVALDVLQRLRHTFVEELDAIRALLKPGELAAAVRAFDTVREAMDRDETSRFVHALGSADALDLVVEIAHDMRSPLTAILMLTGMIRRSAAQATCDVPQQQLGLVYNAAFGLNALVNDVIALARGGDRLIDRECVPFSISALVESVADIVRPIAEERKLALQTETPTVSARLGQPIALSRVLLNLVSNALKFTESGEVAIRVIDKSPTSVRFEVADTGPGILPEMVNRLFEPFGKRPPGVRGRRFSKTGLGLSICRKLVRDMGSELRIDSIPGRGTRFYFDLSLPIADASGVPRLASAML
jgi:signal transduction histidine kinase